jgi:hypothetical protein
MPWRSSCALGARFLVPNLESVRPDRAIGMGCKLVTAGIEMTIDKRVSGEEVLGLFGRFEPLHLPFPSSRWPVPVLGPIIQISAFPMLDCGKQLTPAQRRSFATCRSRSPAAHTQDLSAIA